MSADSDDSDMANQHQHQQSVSMEREPSPNRNHNQRDSNSSVSSENDEEQRDLREIAENKQGENQEFVFNDSTRYRQYNQNFLNDKYHQNKKLCITRDVIDLGDEKVPRDCVAAIEEQVVANDEQKDEIDAQEVRYVIALAKPFNAHKLYITGRKVGDLFSFSMYNP